MHRANEGGNQALFLKGRKRVGADPIMGVIEIEAAVLEPPKPAEVIVDALFDHVSGLTQRGLDDDFADPRLVRRQTRSILAADARVVVSALWRENIIKRFGREAEVGGNGVDTGRYCPQVEESDAELGHRLGLGAGRVFLCVGGIEARKNTTRILQAFVEIHRARPDARLVITGGASLLDHHSYQAAFGRELTALREEASAVSLLGPVADSDMPGLCRLAHALVFASVKEGFGLCVLEAMASGTLVVVSRIPPFVDYLDPSDALWCDPAESSSIAAAMRQSLRPDVASSFRARGPVVAAIWPAGSRRAPPAGLSPPAGAGVCLRCASSSAGPMAGGRAATPHRSSSGTFFARARAIPFRTS
jgi:glycosyltransferase involved in cell wall biosynthesis